MKKNALAVGIAIALLFLLSIVLQQHILSQHFYWDANWGLFCADQLLQGKQYYYDFFETNPPLVILYLLPIVFLGHYFHIASIVVLQNAFFLLILSLLFLNYYLLKRIFNHDRSLIYFSLFSIALVELLFPVEAFTQREHFTLILFFPYVLLLTAQCQLKKISRKITGPIGIGTGIAIALKPYFLLPLLLAEIYHAFTIKRFRALIRFEICLMLFVWIIYLLTVWRYFPQFYFNVLPIDLDLYVVFQKVPLHVLLQGQATLVMLTLVLSWITIPFFLQTWWRHYFWLTLLSALGFFIGYILPGQTWYYHLYPSYALSVFLLMNTVFILLRSVFKKDPRPLYTKLLRLSTVFLASILLTLEVEVTTSHTIHMAFQNNYFSAMKLPLKLCQKSPFLPKNILLLSMFTHTFEILSSCNQAVSSTRFYSLSLIPGIIALKEKHRLSAYIYYKKFFFKLLNADIQKKPPRWIVLDKRGYWLFVHNKLIRGQFLPFLLSNPTFRYFFSHYALVESTKEFSVFAFSSQSSLKA